MWGGGGGGEPRYRTLRYSTEDIAEEFHVEWPQQGGHGEDYGEDDDENDAEHELEGEEEEGASRLDPIQVIVSSIRHCCTVER
jgi:hypothetical protein